MIADTEAEVEVRFFTPPCHIIARPEYHFSNPIKGALNEHEKVGDEQAHTKHDQVAIVGLARPGCDYQHPTQLNIACLTFSLGSSSAPGEVGSLI